MPLRRDTFGLTLLLAAMTTLASMSNDMYIPSLPEIAMRLAAPASQVQLTLSAFLVGFAIGQIFYGPISDKIGRKPTMMVGFGLYVVATIVCASSTSIIVLIAARLVQSLGAAGPIILARAIVRDLYDGPRATRELSVMASITGLGPVLAPIIGGVLQNGYGWRASFIATSLFGIIVGTTAFALLPETLRKPAPGRFSPRELAASFAVVWKNHSFRAYSAILAAAYSGIFAFVSASSFVLQTVYGLHPLQFGVAFMFAAGTMIVGTTIAGRFARRVDRTIGWAVMLMAAGGVLQAVGVWLAPASVIALVGCEMVYVLGLGMALPSLMGAAIMPFPDRAGAAASLSGIIQMTSAAGVGTIAGSLLGDSAWPLVGATLFCGVAALVLYLGTARARSAPAI